MKCLKCKIGTITVHSHCEYETVYKQGKDGIWKASKPRLLAYTNLYAACDACKKEYFVDEYLFYNKGEIRVYETDKVAVEIQTQKNDNPSVKVMTDDKKIFELLEALGWEVDPMFEKLPQIPGMFEKMYYSPKGSELFGRLKKDEVDKLLMDTKKALSENGIPYYSRELTLADML